uniref:Uncharacterized protein n=1 Tax=Arundo donax TaxID=35708 RepID=A0A0A9EY09_ARUDO
MDAILGIHTAFSREVSSSIFNTSASSCCFGAFRYLQGFHSFPLSIIIKHETSH